MPEAYNLISVMGATAGGKTSFAAALAAKLDSAVISADSRQVYRGMSIGTGKDLADYTVNGKAVPYYLIDIADAGMKYNVFEYQQDFLKVYEALRKEDRLPVLCGGTGMYIEAVLQGYRLIRVPKDAELRSELEQKSDEDLAQILENHRDLHNISDTSNRKRLLRAVEIALYSAEHKELDFSYPDIRSLNLQVVYDRNTRRKRISERLRQRMREGMIEEVKQLLDSGVSPETLIYYGLEYKFITEYLLGKTDYDTMFSLLETAIHQFSKRQMTWFRKMERDGINIHRIDGFWPLEKKVDKAFELLSNPLN